MKNYGNPENLKSPIYNNKEFLKDSYSKSKIIFNY